MGDVEVRSSCSEGGCYAFNRKGAPDSGPKSMIHARTIAGRAISLRLRRLPGINLTGTKKRAAEAALSLQDQPDISRGRNPAGISEVPW